MVMKGRRAKMSIEDLDLKYKSFTEIMQLNMELQEKQEHLLFQKFEESKPLIEWYRKKRLLFTHPSIKHRTRLGAILGFDDEEYKLIIYNPDKGLLKVNINNQEEKNMIFEHLIRDDHFENAMEGLEYLKTMIDKYTSDYNQDNQEREALLNKYAND